MKSAATLPNGRPRPVATAESSAFWANAAEGALVLRKCVACERLAPPLAPRCPSCLGDRFAPFQCSGRAALAGRTVLHSPGYPGQDVPVTLVQCAIEEDPRIELVALDTDQSTETLAPGAPVHIGFHTDADGTFAVVAPGAAG